MTKIFSKHLIIIGFGALGAVTSFSSCGKGVNNTTTENTPKDTIKKEIKTPEKVDLKCVDKGVGEFDVPINWVVLSVDGNEQTIDTINTACNVILPTEYKDYEIPLEATSACGGWYAGGGDYFYSIIKDGKVKVFYGWQDEGQEDTGYHWKEMVIKE